MPKVSRKINQPDLFDEPGKRLTGSYGWSYDFDDASFAPAEAIPEWLLPAREKAARFAGLPPGELVQALLIRYDPGAGIG